MYQSKFNFLVNNDVDFVYFGLNLKQFSSKITQRLFNAYVYNFLTLFVYMWTWHMMQSIFVSFEHQLLVKYRLWVFFNKFSSYLLEILTQSWLEMLYGGIYFMYRSNVNFLLNDNFVVFLTNFVKDFSATINCRHSKF